MIPSPRAGWTIRIPWPGEDGSRRIRLGRSAGFLALLGSVLAILVVGVAVGRLWERAREGRRAAELEEELAALEGERERVRELASKVEAMETSYLRIRRALGGEVAASRRDVLLPPLSGAGGAYATAGGVDEGERPWAWPLSQRGFVTRPFGSPVDASPDGHAGLDIAVPMGSYVRAAAPGVVAEAGRDSIYGFYARIAHRDDLSSLYAHNSWVFVAPGDTVERLQVIALSGNTGSSTAPHLHFEIGRNGEALDPLRYVGVGR